MAAVESAAVASMEQSQPIPDPTSTEPTEPAIPIDITTPTNSTPPTPPTSHLLHIRPLSRSVTAAHLRDIFSHFGDVSVAVVPLDSSVQLPLGYGVVGMDREEDADTAVECMDGGWIDGQIVTCSRKAAKAANSQQAQHSHRSISHSPPSAHRDSRTERNRELEKGRSGRDDDRRHAIRSRNERRRSRSPRSRHSWVNHRERGVDRGRGRGEERHMRGGYKHRRSSRSRSRSPSADSRSRRDSHSRSRSRSRSRSKERHRRRR